MGKLGNCSSAGTFAVRLGDCGPALTYCKCRLVALRASYAFLRFMLLAVRIRDGLATHTPASNGVSGTTSDWIGFWSADVASQSERESASAQAASYASSRELQLAMEGGVDAIDPSRCRFICGGTAGASELRTFLERLKSMVRMASLSRVSSLAGATFSRLQAQYRLIK